MGIAMTVVVLGNQLQSEEIHDRLQGRMDVGIEVLRSTNSEYLVLSGAQTNPDVPYAECEVMRDYAVTQGVDEDRIRLDDQAEETVGNGYFTRLIVEDLDAGNTIRVVSSCYHMKRAQFVFEQCYGPGYDIVTDDCYETCIPADELHEEESLEQAREFFDPVTRGDIEAIKERLIEAHYYYDWLAEE